MKSIYILLLTVSMVFIQGCAKERKAVEEPTPVVDEDRFDETPTPPSGDDTSQGNKVPLTITSTSTMEDYTLRPLNDPQNISIEINLDDFSDGDGKFGGRISISYTDNGNLYSSDQRTTYSGSQYGSSGDAQYNIWFTSGGDQVWHGFFEDAFGAIVVVIDEVIDLGDGGVGDLVGGSVWFKNFGATYAPKPPMTRCWFIRRGPYDCRTFMSGGGVSTTSSVNPNNGGYRKLGNFTGLSKSQAFNE